MLTIVIITAHMRIISLLFLTVLWDCFYHVITINKIIKNVITNLSHH